MNYLLIYLTFLGIGIGFDFIKLLLAIVFKFQVKEFKIFAGPKFISTIIFNTEFNIGIIPIGSYMVLHESFFQRDRFSKIIVTYLTDVMLFITTFLIITHIDNDILVTASKLSLIINGFFAIISVIFDTKHIFYRHKK